MTTKTAGITATKRLVFALAATVNTAASASALPTNPDVRQETLQKTICVKGYSSTVRPSTAYTGPIKSRLMRESGISELDRSNWALDHHIPIALGGHPRRLENLQLLTQHDNGRKSRIEVKLLCYVCTGQMPLDQAQQEIWDGWEDAYKRHSKDRCHR